MARKKWTPKPEADLTPSHLRLREKRRWQIALRRYVIDGHPSLTYAPYFALDIQTLRQWFETQFQNDLAWSNFGTEWHIEHCVPVSHFDFQNEDELYLCWNFINLRVEPISNKSQATKMDLSIARSYFKNIHDQTGLPTCLKLIKKIDQIELSRSLNSEKEVGFLTKHRTLIEQIQNYSGYELELLNRGKTVEEVNKEMQELKKIKI